MNPLSNMISKLPLIGETDEDERTPEEIEADEKRARIQFHREKVRNGPAKFSYVTSGQQRRAQARETARMAKLARRKRVKTYFAQERFIATLRGNLQVVGVLPFTDPDFTVPEHVENRALNWLARTFEGDDLEARLKDAASTYVRLTMPVKS